jgi:hypothetical protein
VSIRRGWWLVPEVIVIAVLALLSVPFLASANGPASLQQQIAARAAAIIENETPAEHHAHGHEVTGNDKVICGVALFGTEPAEVKTVDEVQVVYGYYFCAIGSPGVIYMESSRSDGPVVVHFGANPTVTIAQSGQGYADRVRAMMPDQYEDRCFRGLPDPTVAQRVQDRYFREVTPA